MFSAYHYHVVWYPKDRRKVLIPPLEERLKHILHEVCGEHQAEREELEVMPDHVQRYGECRSAMWQSPPDEAGERPFFSFAASGNSCVEAKTADAVDELLLSEYRRRSTALHDQAGQ
jgi:hypothetical protein